MISGHLAQKSGYFYVVLNVLGNDGMRKPKWFSTHLTVKGNKKRAEEMLIQLRTKYTNLENIQHNSQGMLFHEYMDAWLSGMKNKVTPSTYNGYKNIVQNSVCPYFREKMLLLNELKPVNINEYYEYLSDRGVSNNTIIKRHANIRKALHEAYKKDLISCNLADRIERPKPEDYVSHPYSPDEANQLLAAIHDEKLGLLVTVALFYGLRRSEVLGLRWSAVNFEQRTFIINHSVTQVKVDDKYSLHARDNVKHKSSFRTMPLVPVILERLLQEKKRQNPEDNDYVFVDAKGDVIKPNYVSLEFPKLLKRHGLRPIRFHDLRHSCAGLLISQRVPLIEVQQWLGHSTISTTADLYVHLDFATKQNSASTIKKI